MGEIHHTPRRQLKKGPVWTAPPHGQPVEGLGGCGGSMPEERKGLFPTADKSRSGGKVESTLPPEAPGGVSQFTEASPARIPRETTGQLAAELIPNSSLVFHPLET